MQPTNLILIGMPGAGKSTAGVLLAKALGFSFVDTDLLIQTKAQKKLCEILEQQGMQAFLTLEERVIRDLQTEQTVIATGGSVVLEPQAMEHLRSLGAVIYLKLSPDSLQTRIHNMKTRGIVMRTGETLAELYAERSRHYETYADVVLDMDSLTVEETVSELVKQWDILLYGTQNCPS